MRLPLSAALRPYQEHAKVSSLSPSRLVCRAVSAKAGAYGRCKVHNILTLLLGVSACPITEFSTYRVEHFGVDYVTFCALSLQAN